MTNIEVLQDLKSKNKPYEHINPRMNQSYFSLMCIKIENKMCKPKTVEKFFGFFGYLGTWDNYTFSENITLVSNKKEEYLLLHKKKI